MPPRLDLVAATGPIAGTRATLPTDKPLILGRSNKGVHIVDPSVSLEHAKIVYEENNDRFQIEDLRSQTGTIVNGVKLEDAPVTIIEGTEIEIGETLFIVEAQEGLAPWVLPAAGLLVFMIAGVAGLGWWTSRPIVYNPVIKAPAEVSQGGEAKSALVRLPTSLIRQIGKDHRHLRVNKVTDHDENGVSELWLKAGNRDQIWTWDAEGKWRMLGDFPLDCADKTGVVFPDRVCSGMRWRYQDGRYEAWGHEDGIIAFIKPDAEFTKAANEKAQKAAAEANPDAPPPAPRPPNVAHPYRISLLLPELLSAFLEERGIDEPVHYVICEGFLDGVGAQALTASGKIVPLEPGCIRNMTLDGSKLKEFANGANLPVAFAFTHNGYEALQGDIRTWFAGSPDGLFLSKPQRAALNWIGGPVNPRLGHVRITFKTQEPPADDWKPAHPSPIAPEVPITGTRTLLAGTGGAPSTLAITKTISGEGTVQLDPEGCTELSVDTAVWHCRMNKLCTPGKQFLSVSEVGCSDAPKPIVRVPYKGGIFSGKSQDYEYRVQVESAVGNGIDVLRSRVSWRPRVKEEAAPAE